MFEELQDLYSAEIRLHGRSPRHGRRPVAFDGQARGDNPMCGDRVTVFVRRDGGAVAEAGFEARGCEITVASADLMCDVVQGQELAAIRGMAAEVETLARTGDCPACAISATAAGTLRALKPLGAVHEHPSRVRCVTLPWSALVAALEGIEEAVR